MRTATYFNPDGVDPVKLVVIKERGDGTVDLGKDEKTLVISNCRVAKDGKPAAGQCVLDPDKTTAAPADPKK